MEKDYFKNRKSVRKFKNKEISQTLLDDILTRASKAPTTGGMQLYSVIITSDENKKSELAKAHFCQPASTSAPVILTICADFYRFCKWCVINKAVPGYENFLSFTSAMLDATILAQQIVTIAEMEGLGSCYLGTVTYNAPEIASLLKLPELVVPVASLAIGWPDETPQDTERLPLNSFCYREEYPSFSDAEINMFYKVKDEFAANRKFIEENDKETLAQVFTDIRYPKNMNEEISSKLLNFLKKQKFM